MEKYSIELLLKDELGNIISNQSKELKIKENSFDDIENEIYNFRVEELPKLEKSMLENEQNKFKKNKKN